MNTLVRNIACFMLLSSTLVFANEQSAIKSARQISKQESAIVNSITKSLLKSLNKSLNSNLQSYTDGAIDAESASEGAVDAIMGTQDQVASTADTAVTLFESKVAEVLALENDGVVPDSLTRGGRGVTDDFATALNRALGKFDARLDKLAKKQLGKLEKATGVEVKFASAPSSKLFSPDFDPKNGNGTSKGLSPSGTGLFNQDDGLQTVSISVDGDPNVISLLSAEVLDSKGELLTNSGIVFSATSSCSVRVRATNLPLGRKTFVLKTSDGTVVVTAEVGS